MQREFIWGVCDKTGTCDTYFGFFKTYESAKKELEIQSMRLKEDLGMMDISINEDKAYLSGKIVIAIHTYVLR